MTAQQTRKVALAVVAHPDDIEFVIAGTLIELSDAGYEIHMMNLANGSCGTKVYAKAKIVRIREAEARESARLLGATYHPPIVNDIMVNSHDRHQKRWVGGIIREVRPTILFTHNPEDYMQDHMETCWLAVTAAFCKGMIHYPAANYPAGDKIPPYDGEVTIYHAPPHGLMDGMRSVVIPSHFVNIGDVLEKKIAMLRCHKSQQAWLAASQGSNEYVRDMIGMAGQLAGISGEQWKYAEGFRQHSHLGFSALPQDPLKEALGKKVVINQRYEQGLRQGY